MWLSNPRNQLTVAYESRPLVSIIIPAFNRADLLLRAISTVLRHTDVAYELIVINDASSDETADLLERVHGITRITHDTRADFITSCNEGAESARGRYLAFLNSDTEVPAGWLSTLLSTLTSNVSHGAVGARLVHPNGTLQESGAVVWRDGSTASYGRNGDPKAPEYAHYREVDYCSAACLLTRADVFRALKGFDTRYRPAYYEDVDLCFRMRTLGYRVVVDPRVAVIHHEFGSRVSTESLALMAQNRSRFIFAHRDALGEQAEPEQFLRARDRRRGQRVLVIDDQVPAAFLGSGFPRTGWLLRQLMELGCVVTFVASTNENPDEATVEYFQHAGIEVLAGAGLDAERVLRARHDVYDVGIVSRPHNGSRFLDVVRQTNPNAVLIYDAEALYYRREEQRAQVLGQPLSRRRARELADRELRLIKKAHRIIAVSDTDRRTIVRETAHQDVWIWGLPQEPRAVVPGPELRHDLLFVGGFAGGHPPNIDAVTRLSDDLVPKVRQRVKGCRLLIVGSNPPPAVRELSSLSTIVTGYVKDLTPYYDQCRVCVAPFRFGAGISCNVIEAMRAGIPAVVSPLIAAGLGLTHEREVLIARDDEEFVNEVVRVYQDTDLWQRLQRNADAWIRDRCSPPLMRGVLAKIIAARDITPVAYRAAGHAELSTSG